MFKLTLSPIEDRPACAPATEDGGACVVFEGRVRAHNRGREVVALEYEAADEPARTEFETIADEARRAFRVRDIHCTHRVGRLVIGDLAVRIVVTSDHRGAAFSACEYVVDEIKRRLPVWKKEHYADGSSAWLNEPGPLPAPARPPVPPVTPFVHA